MRFLTFRKWLYTLGSAGMLLGAGGCPDNNQLQTIASNSVQAAINNSFAIIVDNAVNGLFGV